MEDLKSQLKQLKNKYPTGEEHPKINNELAAQIKKSLKFIKEQQPKLAGIGSYGNISTFFR
ncbi:hypothetical protein M4I20_06220 [Enterococcus hirae]|uniref:hypothetical protein n=1 Tax=Enterococcus hirae TaxID=1354 RepID=UPI002542BB77|nr:hypothetical protein [Enterococcus hirae]EMF0035781.1 hypothetical protein [Enterococcus hirae]EMF0508037.1 hypothetical protein [Enterococcus hirae]MDK4468010.1 hypothetical protein [Enterococcus hirae]